MHKKRILRCFRYTISTALAISMLLGSAGSSLGIAYARETVEIPIENEDTEAGDKQATPTPIPALGGVSSSLMDGSEFATETETVSPEPTVSPQPTVTELPASPTPRPDSGLTVRGFTASSMEVKVGEEVKFNVFAYSGNMKRYPINIMYTYIDPDTDEEIIMKRYDENDKASYAFDKSGIYTIKVYVIDATDCMITKQLTGLTVLPIEVPTPTAEVTITPTAKATVTPTVEATVTPTAEVTVTPTAEVTVTPTVEATVTPTAKVTVTPTVEATITPIKQPTVIPTKQPTATSLPTLKAVGIKSLTASVKSGKAHVGNSIQLKVITIGENENLKYQFSYKYNGKTTIIKAYNTKATANFKPKKAGTYTLTVKVKDGQGQVVSKSIKSYKVKEKLGVKKVTVSHGSSKLKIKVAAQGTEKNVRYKFVLKKNGKTIQTRTYKSSKSVTFKNISEGKYSITVYVKDSTKKVAKKTVSYTIK